SVATPSVIMQTSSFAQYDAIAATPLLRPGLEAAGSTRETQRARFLHARVRDQPRPHAASAAVKRAGSGASAWVRAPPSGSAIAAAWRKKPGWPGSGAPP